MKRVVLPLLLAFTAPAFATEFVINPTMESKPSPCVWNIDASWLKNSLRNYKRSHFEFEPTFSCEGAVLLRIFAQNQGEAKWFRFTVGFRSGHDRGGLIQFSLVDADGKTVAFGEAKDNLDEGQESELGGTLKIKNEDLANLTSEPNKATLHIKLTVDPQ